MPKIKPISTGVVMEDKSPTPFENSAAAQAA
jgi:hypothetical protein